MVLRKNLHGPRVDSRKVVEFVQGTELITYMTYQPKIFSTNFMLEDKIIKLVSRLVGHYTICRGNSQLKGHVTSLIASKNSSK